MMSLEKQAVMERLDDDLELYREICEIYRADAPGILEKLRIAVDQGNLVDATRSAHSLKSASANVGAVVLSSLAQQAELAGKEGDLHGVAELLPRIQQLLNEALAEIDD